MREDKLIRGFDSSLEGSLLSAIRRAGNAGDEQTLAALIERVGALAKCEVSGHYSLKKGCPFGELR